MLDLTFNQFLIWSLVFAAGVFVGAIFVYIVFHYERKWRRNLHDGCVKELGKVNNELLACQDRSGEMVDLVEQLRRKLQDAEWQIAELGNEAKQVG